MQAKLTRIPWLTALTLLLGAMNTAMSHAMEQQPGEVLKRHGLKRQPPGSTWILLNEQVIRKNVRGARSLAMQLKGAQEQQRALDFGNQSPQVFIDNYRQQIDWLDQRIATYDQELANLGPQMGNRAVDIHHNILVQERNALVFEQRRLSALINNLANQKGQFQELKQQFNTEVARLRESYMETVSDLRKSVDEIMAKYAELKEKEEVSKALKDLSVTLKSKQKLGPSKELVSDIRWLPRLEGSVHSETVELHREHDVDHVDVMLNGKKLVRMVFDTGAGPTTVSAELALQLALRPTGRTVLCETADGTKVMAKEMVIRTASVGRLTVKDVICVVMPKDKGDVFPLLGRSFLDRFDFKYTQGSGRLVITKVEPDEPVGNPGKGNGVRKKR